jgi:uncharacterized protein involved in outer membrane biogenesis
MNKLLKYGLYGVGGLFALILLVIGYFTATFNPNDYKDTIIKLVQEKKQRTLKIDGDIKLTYWPKIGADLGKISLSEHQSAQEFASVNNVKVSLAVMPLLKKELVIDTIYVDGAKANLIKHKDGTVNIDDLMSKDKEESQFKFDIDGVHVTNSAVSYQDEAADATYALSKFNLQTGHVALAEPIDLKTDFAVTSSKPALAANANIKGSFLIDPTTKHYKVKGLDSHITGDMFDGKNVEFAASGDVDAKADSMEIAVDGLKLVASGEFNGAKNAVNLSAPLLNVLKDQVKSDKVTVSLNQTKADGELKVNMVLADMKGSPKAIQSTGISGDIAYAQGQHTLSGKFSSPFSGNIENLVFDIPKLVGNLDVKDPSLPNGGVKGSFDLAAHADIKQEQANSKFNLALDDTKLKGDVAVSGFKQKDIKFNLSADKLDLNKLLGKPSASATTSKSTSSKPADLSALNSMTIDGKLNIGSIVYDKYRVSGLNVGVKADGNKLALNGLNVKVDDSQIKGNLGISNFSKPLYTFDIDIDQVDVDKYVPQTESAPKQETASKPLDLSPLKALNADGSIRIGHLKYGKTNASNININLKGDGEKVSLNPFSAKVDDSQIVANLGITQFSNPAFSFDVKIDKLDADRYITKSDGASTSKSSGDTPIDLSALKKLRASGEANIGWLKLANVKTEHVQIGLKANDGIVNLSPFAADLYSGNMNGSLKVDARSTPSIAFKQSMKGVQVGPLMVDAIKNDMLSGKGTVNVDVTTQGNTVNSLKKALAGTALLALADGAIKGVDIAGSIRDMKNKVNVFKSKDAVDADKSKKTDFSELTASFNIKNGVAHNDDLEMKAPILRLAKGDSKGDIDIGNETINYTAKPTVVKSLKGQGGADLDQLSGIAIPIKISGTFSNPKYGMDLAAVGTALAQSKLLDKVGGDKGTAVKELLNGDNKADALKGLLGKKKSGDAAAASPAAPTDASTTNAAPPAEQPKSAEDQAKEKAEKKLKKLLKF